MSLEHHPARARTSAARGVQSDYVVSEPEAAQILGLSTDTLRRMVKRGDGPPRIKISPRRIGYRERDLSAWLDERAQAAG